jgi:hypothetical protein
MDLFALYDNLNLGLSAFWKDGFTCGIDRVSGSGEFFWGSAFPQYSQKTVSSLFCLPQKGQNI